MQIPAWAWWMSKGVFWCLIGWCCLRKARLFGPWVVSEQGMVFACICITGLKMSFNEEVGLILFTFEVNCSASWSTEQMIVKISFIFRINFSEVFLYQHALVSCRGHVKKPLSVICSYSIIFNHIQSLNTLTTVCSVAVNWCHWCDNAQVCIQTLIKSTCKLLREFS